MSQQEETPAPSTEEERKFLDMVERVREDPELVNLISSLADCAKRIEDSGVPGWLVAQTIHLELRASPLEEMARRRL